MEKRGFRPAASLARPPVVFDPRALSILEGLRAALAVAVIVAAGTALQRPNLMLAALGALLTCLADPGGPLRQRVRPLIGFAVIGAVLLGGFGLVRGLSPFIALPLAACALFVLSLVRIYGLAAQQLGGLLAVALILAFDAPLPGLGAALAVSCFFLAGSLWAVLLTLVIWPLYPYGPIRHALATVWRALGDLARDLGQICDAPPGEIWDEHARVHRRAVRQAIEEARAMLVDALSARGASGVRAAQSLIRFEAAEQIFGALIGLSHVLEDADQESRRAGSRLLRHATPLFLLMARATEADRPVAPEKIGRVVAALEAGLETAPGAAPRGASQRSALAPFARRIAERLVLASTLSVPGNLRPGAAIGAAPSLGWRARFAEPLAANLRFSSLAFRHALRVAVVGAPALALADRWAGPLGHWLTITLLLTMQPYFALTWVRALERIGGTVLGGMLAAAIATFCRSPLTIVAALFPLSVVTFSLRRVSYGLYIAALTPLVVLLVEMEVPGTGEIAIALERVVYTLIGGALAVVGTLVLWPSFEPERLAQELSQAIEAHASYGDAVFSFLIGEAAAGEVEAWRRAAGLASNNLEASLQRALNEPVGRRQRRLEVAALIDAALRRIAGRLAAMQQDAALAGSVPRGAWAEWRAWFDRAMQVAAKGDAPPPRPALPQGQEADRGGEALARIARQVELIPEALARP
ncbi:MAG TPA: FUSC family protein [Acetobacteraceae bacterium]|nr:FUSC family protein [Acetobacteraceae bacterium]